jgi:SAM-dependent methyltransferase
MSGTASDVTLITWTTRYRDGGPQLTRAAHTLADDKRRDGHHDVRLVRVESKADFVAAVESVARAGLNIRELHFLGHSGMYGPMFRTTAMPEQFSPHEWRTLRIPFADGAQAFFHACRTARWFAPFFARTFGVRSWGYHWYTTFSAEPGRFVWAHLLRRNDAEKAPLYLIGCRGRKSDGIVGSVAKYTGLMRAEPMKSFDPQPVGGEASYDGVAPLYAEVFEDITVRRDEWHWLESHLPHGPIDLLDIGCGTGSLLGRLAPRLSSGVGVDASRGMIAEAKRRNTSANLSFQVIDGPRLPFPDGSFDVVTSLLSWRYLDWDPLMMELQRVLRPGGHLLVIDMVMAPVKTRELPRFVRDTARAVLQRASNDRYRAALARLTRDPRWRTMLQYNPIRAEHEYVWYFESRFPGRRVERLNIGWHARVLAFDSGPMPETRIPPQTWP